MVSTRQMSITTVEAVVSSSLNASSGASRFGTNSANQSNGTIRQQQTNSSTIAGPVINDSSPTTIPKSPIQLTDMPLEIFEKIFQYTGYKEVSNMRLVSTQMNQVCKTILNSTFTKLQTQLMKRFQNIKNTMPRRESARRSHPLSHECDIVETCCMRLSLLQMTFGRYIEHKHICFFPGVFLDEVYNVLNCIRTTPMIGRPYKITEELIDLSTMAMEYFKDHLEPTMPQFGLFRKDFFAKGSSTVTKASPKNCYSFDTSASASSVISTRSSQSSSMPSPPQSNMVLRKGIRKIKQGMKRYNNQLSVLRTDLRFCKRKSTDQTKQITELQNMLAEQQKQTLEYANRLDENDKKSEEMSRKISTLLQELNKCKIELHYYRSKSPATPFCNNCGQTTLTVPPGDLLAIIKDNMNSRDETTSMAKKNSNDSDLNLDEQKRESNIIDLIAEPQLLATNSIMMHMDKMSKMGSTNELSYLDSANGVITNDNQSTKFVTASEPCEKKRNTLTAHANESTKSNKSNQITSTITQQSVEQHPKKVNNSSSVIITVGTPRFYGKRKYEECLTISSDDISLNLSEFVSNINIDNNNQLSTNNLTMINNLNSKQNNVIATNNLSNSNLSDNYGKKARRVQSKRK